MAMASLRGATGPEADVSHVGVLAALIIEFQKELASELEQLLDSVELSDYGAAPKSARKRAPTSALSEDGLVFKDVPRTLRFYEPMLVMTGKVAQSCTGTAIELLLEFLPDHSKEWSTLESHDKQFGQKEELAYGVWTKKVRNFDTKNNRQADIVRSVVDIAVADFISYLLRGYDPRHVSRELLTKLTSLAQHFNRNHEPSFPGHAALWQLLRRKITEQWAAIFSFISGLGGDCHPSDLVGKGIQIKKEPEQSAYFRCMRWLKLNIQIASNEALTFLTNIPAVIEGAKHKSVKIQLIKMLDHALQSISWENAMKIAEKMKLITKKATKWSKSDDLEGPAFRVLATILCHGAMKLYDAEFDSLMKKILKRVASTKDRKRDELLMAVLKLLAGRWTGHQRMWWPRRGASFDHFIPSGEERPYQYVPLADFHRSMNDRMANIITILFGKKLVATAGSATIDILTDIAVQICSHSMSFAHQKLFPVLFSEKLQSTTNFVVGLRALRIIADPSSHFYEECGWGSGGLKHPNLVTAEHGMDADEVQRMCATKMEALAKLGDGQVGLQLSGTSPKALRCSSPFSVTDTEFAPFNYDETEFDVVNFKNMLRSISIDRTKSLIASQKTYAQSLADEETKSRNRVHDIVEKWFEYSNVRCQRNDLTASHPIVLQPFATTENIAVDLMIEVLECVPVLLPPHIKSQLADPEACISRYLIHPDQVLATRTSHMLQKLLLTQPTYRSPMLQGLVGFAMKFTDADSPSLKTLLRHLCVLLDLWVVQNTQERMTEAATDDTSDIGEVTARTSEFLLNISTLKEIEAFCLFNLCHHDPAIRSLSMRVVNAASIISPVTYSKTLAYILRFHGREIVQLARYRYLLDATIGVRASVKIFDHSPLPTLMEAATTSNRKFWAYVVGDIGRFCALNGVNVELGRHLLLTRLKSMSAAQVVESNLPLLQIRINYHNLLFSISGSAPDQETDAVVQQDFEEYVASKTGGGFFSNLLLDQRWASEEVALAVGSSHPLAIGQVLRLFASWFNGLGKKLKPKARGDMAKVLRYMVQERSFADAIAMEDDICEVVVSLLDQIREALDKGDRHGQEELFVEYCLIVGGFAKGQFRHKPCTTRGPVRVYLSPSVTKHWPTEGRSAAYKLMQSWGSMSRGARAGEIGKALASIKDPERKAQRKEELELLYDTMATASREAFAYMSSVGPLFLAKERRVQSDVISWAKECEHEGKRVLRWLLSFHWTETIETFINASFGQGCDPEETHFFTNAIFDQFIPMCDPPIPQTGVAAHVQDYYEKDRVAQEGCVFIESSPLTNEDIALCDLVSAKAGSLIFMVFYTMMDRSPELRSRAFAMMQRLVPAVFGARKTCEGNAELEKVEESLKQYRSVFTAQIFSAARLNALAVSNIAATANSTFTETLFREAFKRIVKLKSENGRRWVLEFLNPWAGNIVLNRINLSDFTPDTFLEAMFNQFTTELIKNDLILPNELIAFWQKVAQADSINHHQVVNFLLRTGIQSVYNMHVCKTVLVSLYRGDTPASVEPLVKKLSFWGIQGNKDPIPPDDPLYKPANVERAEEAFNLRKAAISTLRELAIESLQPILPYLHVLLTWSVLRINAPEETENVSQLLMNVIESIMNLLVNSGHAQHPVVNNLCRWSNELYTTRVRLRWSYSAYRRETRPQGSCTGEAMIIERPGPEFVNDMQGALYLLGAGEIVQRWGKEAMDWGLFHKDYQMSVPGVEIFRYILASVDTQMVEMLLARLISAVETLQKLLDDVKSVEAKGARKVKGKETTDDPRDQIPLVRGLATELLQTMAKIVPLAAAANNHTAMQLIFWAAVSFLRVTDKEFQPMVFEALVVCMALEESDFFGRIANKADYVSMQENVASCPGWCFRGLLPLIIQGLFSQRTEHIAGHLISRLVRRPPHPLIHPNSDAVLPVAVCGLVPWLSAKLSLLDNASAVVLDVLQAFVESFSGGIFAGTKVESALRSVASGAFNGKPLQFLDEVSIDIGAKCLPARALEIGEVLAVTVSSAISESFALPILVLTGKFLNLDNAIEFVDDFTDVVQYCAGSFSSNLSLSSGLLLRTTELALKKSRLPTASGAIQSLQSLERYNSDRYESEAISQLVDRSVLDKQREQGKESDNLSIDTTALANTLTATQKLFFMKQAMQSSTGIAGSGGSEVDMDAAAHAEQMQFSQTPNLQESLFGVQPPAAPEAVAPAVPSGDGPPAFDAEMPIVEEKPKAAPEQPPMDALAPGEGEPLPEIPATPNDGVPDLSTATEEEMLDFLEGISEEDNWKQREEEQRKQREREEAERRRMAEAEEQRQEARRRKKEEEELAKLPPLERKQKLAELEQQRARKAAKKPSKSKFLRQPPPSSEAPLPPDIMAEPLPQPPVEEPAAVPVAAPAVEDDVEGEVNDMEDKLALLDRDDLDEEELAKLARELGVDVEAAYESAEDSGTEDLDEVDDDDDGEDDAEAAELEKKLALLQSEDLDDDQLQRLAAELGVNLDASRDTVGRKADAQVVKKELNINDGDLDDLQDQLAHLNDVPDDEAAELERKLALLEKGDLTEEELAKLSAELGVEEDDEEDEEDDDYDEDDTEDLEAKLAMLESGDLDDAQLEALASELGVEEVGGNEKQSWKKVTPPAPSAANDATVVITPEAMKGMLADRRSIRMLSPPSSENVAAVKVESAKPVAVAAKPKTSPGRAVPRSIPAVEEDEDDGVDLEKKLAMLEGDDLTDEQLSKLAAELGVNVDEDWSDDEEEPSTTQVTPAKVEPVKAEPVKVESVKVEPLKVEPVKVEPVKVEPVSVSKVEPVSVGANAPTVAIPAAEVRAGLQLRQAKGELAPPSASPAVVRNVESAGGADSADPDAAAADDLEAKLSMLENDELDDAQLAALAAELGLEVEDGDWSDEEDGEEADVSTADQAADDELAELEKQIALLESNDLDDAQLEQLTKDLADGATADDSKDTEVMDLKKQLADFELGDVDLSTDIDNVEMDMDKLSSQFKELGIDLDE